MAAPPSRPLPLLVLLLLLPGEGPAGPPPGWPWGDPAPAPALPRPPRPRCSGDRPGVSLSRAPPGLGFSLRRCFVSPRSSPGPSRGPPPVPRPLVVLRGGCGAGRGRGEGPGGARRRLRGSFVLPARFPEPLQFLHCRLRLCRHRGDTGTPGGLPACRAEACPRRRGEASGSGPAPRSRPRDGPAPGRALRTVTRPIVVTLGTPATPAPGTGPPSGDTPGPQTPLQPRERRPEARLPIPRLPHWDHHPRDPRTGIHPSSSPGTPN
ncbi:transforming growth factor-beta receptor type 3-like protein isoform X3 [Poecile atricapillus]|uniref:transforming growth factor-beta receptor type 3-like protein isoform X3 n=1 Tax=Poecile atricapillus TaxID=48891 RepID=UPI002738FE17|nr:transforming growth factor-beta receptor type 3-like protein isoform X3 [Poecile atricapillus]